MTIVSELSRAESVAVRAAARSGVTVQEIVTPSDAARAAVLLQEVWRGPQLPVPGNLIRTVQHAGGYVFGAYDESGSLLAVSLGLRAPGSLHSHITGVAPKGQRRGLGFALKQHQRCWALDQGYERITWTCDPLIRRNMLFNLHALGAEVVGYLVDHYGPMDDSVNTGGESDRFELYWELLGEPAVAATGRRLPLLVSDHPEAVRVGPTGLPECREVAGAARLIGLPSDIEALRRADVAAAHLWRTTVRTAVQAAFAEGASVTGLTATGQLVLEVAS